MNFYHSGVGGQAEYEMLCRARVRRVLVNPFQLKFVGDRRAGVALDCDAYRVAKGRIGMSIGDFCRLALDKGPFDFVTARDRLGDPEAAREGWTRMKAAGVPNLLPVWQIGAPRRDLEEYLDEAPLVGVGGLVPLLQDERTRDRVTEETAELCARHPGRLHLFGAYHLGLIAGVKNTAGSLDTSLWLEGARRRLLVFTDGRTGRLTHAPAARLAGTGLLPGSTSREALCTRNAENIEEYSYCGADSPQGRRAEGGDATRVEEPEPSAASGKG